MSEPFQPVPLPKPQLQATGRLATTSPLRFRTVALLGAQGGAGCTTLAVNLACTLALAGPNRVALVDLDLCLGDADVWLDLVPSATLADVVREFELLDLARLERLLETHKPTGLRFLAHPSQIGDATLVEARHLRRVLDLLRSEYTHVLLDVGKLGKSLTPMDIAALQLVDAVLLVLQSDISGVRNAIRLLLTLKEHEGLEEKTLVIMNRFDAVATEIGQKKVEESLGKPLFAKVPDDTKAASAARAAGQPLPLHSPKSPVQASLATLARKLFE